MAKPQSTKGKITPSGVQCAPKQEYFKLGPRQAVSGSESSWSAFRSAVWLAGARYEPNEMSHIKVALASRQVWGRGREG